MNTGRKALTSPHHHGSHRHLIDTPADPCPADVDAIIVPTARNAAALKPVIKLAAELDCVLLLLCSKWSSPRAVIDLARRQGAHKVAAVDAEHLPPDVLPRFTTTERLDGTRFHRSTDTSAKRNIGLLVARLAGWQRIVFLDDDITVPDPQDLRNAVGLTDTYAGVGLSIGGFPDNSVVCHAYRDAGGTQDMFIGGGALAVGTGSMDSFFPNIYNEDWFFLLGEDTVRPLATTGTALQQPYDPFADPRRARREELGDCLAEGLFGLLDAGKSIHEAGFSYWREFLTHRIDFISDVIAMVEGRVMDPGDRARMLASLKAARGRCEAIWPLTCLDYVNAWQQDRILWRKHMEHLLTSNKVDGARKALSTLGLEYLELL